ncbi:uncharacterized protein EV154DRAFT_510404, partial [Mucor mucedo]|uniref:uncharacterized protein n=1 Tax=Mucor mucedo TaxID=29922 RepID=UPI00221F5B34
MEGAVAFNTCLGTYRHSLRHRFRALAWQLGSALACNFAFNTAFGTGVYHLRASALASILVLYSLRHWLR